MAACNHCRADPCHDCDGDIPQDAQPGQDERFELMETATINSVNEEADDQWHEYRRASGV